jgi:hypothetical protein
MNQFLTIYIAPNLTALITSAMYCLLGISAHCEISALCTCALCFQFYSLIILASVHLTRLRTGIHTFKWTQPLNKISMLSLSSKSSRSDYDDGRLRGARGIHIKVRNCIPHISAHIILVLSEMRKRKATSEN